LEDQKLNRVCVGEDRKGNKFYQYYSYYGLPTRREVLCVINNNRLDSKMIEKEESMI